MATAFKKLKAKLATEPGVTSPGGLAAYIGRKKYGNRAFNKKIARGEKK